MLGYGKVVYTVPGDDLLIVGPMADELEYNGFSGNIFDWPHANSRIGLEMPYFRIDSARGDIYSLPLWLPNLLTAVMLSFLVVRDKKHARQSTTTCLDCEYDLTGNESGTCPECGTAIAPPNKSEVAG